MGRRKRKKPEQLVWPRWLIQRASCDTPSWDGEGHAALLVRFQSAGVTSFVPVRGEEVLDAAEAATATAIGVAGPGLLVAEPLGEETAPVTAAVLRLCPWLETYDELRVLRLAALDMGLAAAAARGLVDEDGPARFFERVLETGLVVTYARPYMGSDTRALSSKWRPSTPDDVELHERIIHEFRNPYHAHTERSGHRGLIDTAGLLGIEGPPTFAEAWTRLGRPELERLASLAERQAQRLSDEADRLGAILGERRDVPSYRPKRRVSPFISTMESRPPRTRCEQPSRRAAAGRSPLNRSERCPDLAIVVR